MINLIPRDLWEFRLEDLFSSFINQIIASANNSPKNIYIDELGNCLPVSSGRAALAVAIKSLALRPQARIGVPLFCCPVVFETIKKTGGKPVFIDCDQDTYCLSIRDLEKKIKSLDCLLVVHMFGHAADMDGILDIASGIPVIEDCAQALGSKYAGKMLGSYGKVSIFSFRSGKYISAGEGGAIFSADPVMFNMCINNVHGLPKPTLTEEIKHIFTNYLKSCLRRRPLYGIIGRRIWYAANKHGRIGREESLSIRKIYMSDYNLIIKRLKNINSMVLRQRNIADVYLRELRLDPEMLSWEKPKSYYNRIYFPIKFSSRKVRDEMAKALLELNIDSMKYLDQLATIARKYFGYDGGCQISEDLAERTLCIPCYYRLKESEVEKIIKSINCCWSRFS